MENNVEGEQPVRVLPGRGLRELLQQVAGPDETVELEPEAEEALQEVADDFVDNVAAFACQLARHRSSNTLEPKDVLLHLQANCGIKLGSSAFAAQSAQLAGWKRSADATDEYTNRAAAARRTALRQGQVPAEQQQQQQLQHLQQQKASFDSHQHQQGHHTGSYSQEGEEKQHSAR